MHVLFLSNFYPPASRGGYEQWCQEILEGLRSRGHDMSALTSAHGRDALQSPDPGWILRKLNLEMEITSLKNALQFFAHRKRREQENLSLLQKAIENHKLDAILIWGMWNLPRSLPAFAEQLLPGKVAYYVGDYWLALPNQFENYWNAPARNPFTGIPKAILKPIAKQILAREQRPALQLEHGLFPSSFMRDELQRRGASFKNSKIIYGAIDTKPYTNIQKNKSQNETVSLLYIGRLTPEKGAHTAIEAMGRLVHEHGLKNFKLTIVGDGEADYLTHLRQLAETKNVASFVTFQPALPKAALPALYQRSDIFLFTSIWAEPFGRVIVEAMASGVAVVGTKVGGAAEILIDEQNALTFTADDPASLSDQLKRLIESRDLRQRLADSARETAVRKFDIRRMIEEIEAYLQNIALQ